jgi:hypothetical protein
MHVTGLARIYGADVDVCHMRDRVCQIQPRHLTSSQMECVADSVAVQKPFLLELQLALACMNTIGEPILPDPFLGRNGTTSFGLPKLLSSATHRVHLLCLDLLNS